MYVLGVMTTFHAKKVPQIAIEEYAERIALYLRCEDPIYLVVLIYIDRIVAHNPAFFITTMNVHRYSTAAIGQTYTRLLGGC